MQINGTVKIKDTGRLKFRQKQNDIIIVETTRELKGQRYQTTKNSNTYNQRSTNLNETNLLGIAVKSLPAAHEAIRLIQQNQKAITQSGTNTHGLESLYNIIRLSSGMTVTHT